MKKFKKIGAAVLTGAIAFGAVGAVDLAKPIQAEAADWSTNWGFTNESNLGFIDNDPNNLGVNKAHYYSGDTYYFASDFYSESYPPDSTIKIFKIESDGTMNVYKTLTGTSTGAPDWKEVFTTTFGSTYYKGTYVAIAQINYDEGGVSKTRYAKSNNFLIN